MKLKTVLIVAGVVVGIQLVRAWAFLSVLSLEEEARRERTGFYSDARQQRPDLFPAR